jgi:hypothetical protein
VLSLVLVFGSVFSSSSFIPINSFADMPGDSTDGGDSDGGNGDNQENSGDEEDDNDIPDSKEAPATAGSLTAGGDLDNDDDNDNDSGGNRDKDNDDDNEPASKDAPQTADTVTANKPDCPKGQEYYLFSASCKPVGGSDSTNGATSAPMGCPIISEKMKPGNLLSNPGLRAHCTAEPVTITNKDGTNTTYDPDGTKSISTYVGSGDAKSLTQVDKYDADDKLISRSQFDPSTNTKVQTKEYVPGTTNLKSQTTYNPIDGKPVEKLETYPGTNELERQTVYDNTGKPQKVVEFFTDEFNDWHIKKFTIYSPDGGRVETDRIDKVETTYDKEGKVTKSVDLAK